ncbi:hypothetical protein HZP90_05935 [Elizabethkingia anophelis]|nr:hypothetical protein [Elizabethkingia anophelis]MCT4058154.1 hypothetical protein [Elizabethkingia anophelis]MCT4068763.1 hypothetical protein [Elizabethkingia anophelis]
MAVPQEYRFTIRNFYVKTQQDNIEITNGLHNNTKWSDGYKGFRSNIREHLKLEHNGRCAFCRCRVSTGTSYSNLEHIVPKGKYPQFEFLPQNLVYCCTRCNFGKGEGVTLSNPLQDRTQQLYPDNSAGFNIVNPYYDNFEDHINFIDDVIIVAENNSDKGKKTIKFYKLYRPELAEDRAFELRLDKQAVTHQLLARLTEPELDQGIINQINTIISRIPTWTL